MLHLLFHIELINFVLYEIKNNVKKFGFVIKLICQHVFSFYSQTI